MAEQNVEREPFAAHGWHWMWVAELRWRQWGLSVELSFGAWWPREYSVALVIGPLLLQGGIEENYADD